MQFTTLYNGASGLKAFANAMQSVSDNIANVSTAGYKGTRGIFQDLLSQEMSLGGETPQQVGNGSTVFMANQMSQGTIETTGNTLDMAVSGNGFFIVNKDQGTAATATYYTRAGQFLVNDEGYLVNSQGDLVQGFAVDSSGVVSPGATQDIEIPTTPTTATVTSLVELGVNLDASDYSTNTQGTAIDPTDSSTFNYAMAFSAVDVDGDSQDVIVYFQRLSSYVGNSPAGSSSVWKMATFQNDSGTITANPTAPANQAFLHFDTNGQLVGTSYGDIAAGDSYTSDTEVASGAADVSDQLGETLTYTGSGAAQTISTSATVAFSAGTSAGDTVTIGADVYTFGATASAAAAASWLTDQINANSALTYYAMDDNAGTVTLRAKSGAAAMDVTTTAASATVDDDTTLNQVISTINSGNAATGSLNLNLAGMTAGVSTVTVGTNTWTYGVANDFSTISDLTNLIANLSGVDATTTGTSIYITAASAGLAGNSIALATNDAANVVVSSATMLNGVDSTTDSSVVASAVIGGGGQTALQLERTDVGATATITLGGTNTLGAGLGLDYNTYTQVTTASDGNATVSTDGEVPLTFSFTKTDPVTLLPVTNTQDITLDYSPDGSSASTQTAGNSEAFYLNQDGVVAGNLISLDVSDTGVIWGAFSNGDVQAIAAVALATFTAAQDLAREGDNYWSETVESGAPTLAAAGDATSGAGLIQNFALESSTVDLATELVNMINYQRSFQANSKSVTTADEMLKVAINLKG